VLDRRNRHFVIWYSSYSYLWCTRTKSTKTVNVTVKVTHEVGTVLKLRKHIFVFDNNTFCSVILYI